MTYAKFSWIKVSPINLLRSGDGLKLEPHGTDCRPTWTTQNRLPANLNYTVPTAGQLELHGTDCRPTWTTRYWLLANLNYTVLTAGQLELHRHGIDCRPTLTLKTLVGGLNLLIYSLGRRNAPPPLCEGVDYMQWVYIFLRSKHFDHCRPLTMNNYKDVRRKWMYTFFVLF